MRIDQAGSEVKILNYRIKMSVFAKKDVAHMPQVRGVQFQRDWIKAPHA